MALTGRVENFIVKRCVVQDDHAEFDSYHMPGSKIRSYALLLVPAEIGRVFNRHVHGRLSQQFSLEVCMRGMDGDEADEHGC